MSKVIFERPDAPAHVEERLQRLDQRMADLVAAVAVLSESADPSIAERVALLLNGRNSDIHA
ncbi:MAG TPA: hypothetical protein VE172_05925 [Stackebrandtia sp.]|jgi:predicted house-cleaning NTP pyrophosphatase (Maf/HAM1 superfamily)|uniref:hypothetical protein n=1 Tax=Stackebrandtia sp. TaxID=2023065 RepID=UPI002D36E9F6|nr:hypothetical protein [Stackebrandtia sp.]HZE38333.1 hypothetical protein [Stackebrandtia sp.]